MKKFLLILTTMLLSFTGLYAEEQDHGDMIVNFQNGTKVTYKVDNVKSITFRLQTSWTVVIPDDYIGNEVYLVIDEEDGEKRYKMDQEVPTSTYTTEQKAAVGDEYYYEIKQKGTTETCATKKRFVVTKDYAMTDDISEERLDCEKASWSVTIPDANIGEEVWLQLNLPTGELHYKMTQVGSTAEYVTEQKADAGDEYTYYLKSDGFEKCTISRTFTVPDTYTMVDDISDESLDCHAGISESEITMNVGETHQLFMYKGGNPIVATWSSADENIAKVSSLGYVYAIREGTTIITGEYNGEKVYCTVTCKYVSKDYRLNGSQYFLFMMDENTSKYVSGRVTADMRPNGSYIDEEGNIMPEDADCLLQIWNPSAEIEDWPNEGENSFGTEEDWFGTASAEPTPPEGWGNVCGGAILTNNNNKFALLKNITSEHVLIVSIKGNYSDKKSFKYGMKVNGKEAWFLTVDRPTGLNRDGSWETFEIPVTTIEEALTKSIGKEFHFATSDISEKKDFFTFLFKANGAGNTVDLDAAFFYIPAAQ